MFQWLNRTFIFRSFGYFKNTILREIKIILLVPDVEYVPTTFQ